MKVRKIYGGGLKTSEVFIKEMSKTRCFIKLLPLQGAGRNAMIPRAMPWATSFCPFRGRGASRKGAAEIYTTPEAASILLLSIQLSA